MAKMLNKPDKMRSCGCCPWYLGPSGRRWEERFWRHEWDDYFRREDIDLWVMGIGHAP